ncbi:hypothetical protein ACGYLM_01615 [Sulfitobacter sp. 1A10445]|uniref:hypothetical protein n=1 Tax=unclassified Sulfitobacter TaxID=196795 RepID=UPI00374656B9
MRIKLNVPFGHFTVGHIFEDEQSFQRAITTNYTDALVAEAIYSGFISEVDCEYEWPKVGDKVYFLNSMGDILEQVWTSSTKQKRKREMLGIYETKKLAELALLVIKNSLHN